MQRDTDPKHILRRHMLHKLRAVPEERRREQSACLRERLAKLLAQAPATVALYAAMPHEVDLVALVEEHPEHRFAFPRCHPGRRMSFHLVSTPAQQLEDGAFGIPTPRPSCREIEPEEFTHIVVPGVAFTPEGKRLGYGGGYYDTYLPRCPRAKVLAAAYTWQLLADLPTEAHDKLIPLILTP